MSEADKKPNPIDVHVGSRVRLKRTMNGYSQEKLGDLLGITFQQVQKYEKGTNRISASKLKEIADALGMSVGFLFEGLPAPGDAGSSLQEPSAPDFITDFLSTSEGIQLTRSFQKIKDPKVRKKVLDLIKTLGEDDDPLEN